MWSRNSQTDHENAHGSRKTRIIFQQIERFGCTSESDKADTSPVCEWKFN